LSGAARRCACRLSSSSSSYPPPPPPPPPPLPESTPGRRLYYRLGVALRAILVCTETSRTSLPTGLSFFFLFFSFRPPSPSPSPLLFHSAFPFSRRALRVPSPFIALGSRRCSNEWRTSCAWTFRSIVPSLWHVLRLTSPRDYETLRG
jgi:hypothetical protein